jgi:hypothetical protein
MKPARRLIDITNQKLGVRGLSAEATYRRRVIIVGIMPAIRRFIDSNSAMNVPFRAPT